MPSRNGVREFADDKKTDVFQNPLVNLWQGNVHMHTAFWMAWVVPMAIYMVAYTRLNLVADAMMFAYMVFSTIGAWRSTKNPPGRLWVPALYRLLLGLFFLVLIVALGGVAYSFIKG